MNEIIKTDKCLTANCTIPCLVYRDKPSNGYCKKCNKSRVDNELKSVEVGIMVDQAISEGSSMLDSLKESREKNFELIERQENLLNQIVLLQVENSEKDSIIEDMKLQLAQLNQIHHNYKFENEKMISSLEMEIEILKREEEEKFSKMKTQLDKYEERLSELNKKNIVSTQTTPRVTSKTASVKVKKGSLK